MKGRLAGAVYLTFFVTAIAGALLTPGTGGPGGLTNDAAVAATSITQHESLYQVGVALGLISTIFYVALIGLLYALFRPVSRTSSVLMAFFGLVGSALTAFGALFQLAPLVVLGGSGYLSVFDARQQQALSLLFLNLGGQDGAVSLVFFGVFQLFLGYLIYRSTFLPRILGVLIAVAGVGWLTYLYQPLATFLVTELEVLGFAAEAALMLWLLVKGVDTRRWSEVPSL